MALPHLAVAIVVSAVLCHPGALQDVIASVPACSLS